MFNCQNNSCKVNVTEVDVVGIVTNVTKDFDVVDSVILFIFLFWFLVFVLKVRYLFLKFENRVNETVQKVYFPL